MKTDERPRFGIEEPADDGGMSALKAGLIVAGLVVVLLVILILTRPDQLDPEPVTLQPSIPTEAEAEAIAEELFARLDTMYRTRDITLVEQVFAPGAEGASVVRNEIRDLISKGVLDESEERTLSIEIISTSVDRITGTRRYRFGPKLVSEETGKDITKRPGRQLIEVLDFKLVLGTAGWRIDHQKVVEQAKVNE